MEYIRKEMPQNLSLEEQKKYENGIAEKHDGKYTEERRDILDDLANRKDIKGLIVSFKDEELSL